MKEVIINNTAAGELTVEEAMKLYKLGYEFVVEDGMVTHIYEQESK